MRIFSNTNPSKTGGELDIVTIQGGVYKDDHETCKFRNYCDVFINAKNATRRLSL